MSSSACFALASTFISSLAEILSSCELSAPSSLGRDEEAFESVDAEAAAEDLKRPLVDGPTNVPCRFTFAFTMGKLLGNERV